MKTPIIRIRDVVASLLLGAAATAAIAWTISLTAVPDQEISSTDGKWPVSPESGWVPRPPAEAHPDAIKTNDPYLRTPPLPRSAWPTAPRSQHTRQTSWPRGGLVRIYAWGSYNDSFKHTFSMQVCRTGWPLLAMQTRSANLGGSGWKSLPGEAASTKGSLSSGLKVPLHWVPSQADWSSVRLPLRPILLGFALNTFLFAIPALLLVLLWRLQPARRIPWSHPITIILLGVAINMIVSISLWTRWQRTSPPRQLTTFTPTWDRSAEKDALRLYDSRSNWPVTPPHDWPQSPSWIGWLGKARGVRAYEFTSNGVPRAAIVWRHVTWDNYALDQHQKMNIVQTGWPLPSLQSEETIEVAWRTKGGSKPSWNLSTSPTVRRGLLSNFSLPGGAASTRDTDPLPLIPLRPLPIGILINSLLFASALAPLLWTPGAIRTLRRLRRGACPKCGYDSRGLAVCPECGTPCNTAAA